MNDADGDPNLVKQQIENLNSDLNVTSGND